MNHQKNTFWIDLDNSPHVPFFYPIIKELKRRDFNVFITVRDCFQTRGLADLYKLEYVCVGRHYGKNKLLKVLGTVYRALQLKQVIHDKKLTLGVSHGSRAQLIACNLSKIPSVVISDYEYAQGLVIIRPTWQIMPEILKETQTNGKNKLYYPGIKEDIYVAGFQPSQEALRSLGLSKENFIVTIRPPATEAHYHNPESEKLFEAVVDFLSTQTDPDVKMVILPRNEKSQKEFIQRKWKDVIEKKKIIIPEKVVNGLDLIWFSDLVISGGGTMNREAAALGVPVYSIFRGPIGAIDRHLSQEGRLILIKSVDEIKDKLKLVPRNKDGSLPERNKKSFEVLINHLIGLATNAK